MPTLEEVKKQIKSLDEASRFLGRKEIKELPSILWEDEHVEKMVQGIYEKGLGILVATNKRLIFVDKGLLYGLRVEDFPYEKITSIQYKTGLIFGEITIFASGNKADIEQIEKKQARNFAEYIRARITESKDHAAMSAQNSRVTALDIADQIRKLAELRDQGILTEQEFLSQKRKILDKNNN